ncbi:MAG TPA: hypothetical protein VFH73_16630, partial [Polyangia bacterium]|nr:hypothetical protein [Polyangia bacterium]
MREHELTVPKRDEVAEWDGLSVTRGSAGREVGSGGVGRRLASRVNSLAARFVDFFSRRGAPRDMDSVALTRTGGAIARWISFPRGVRFATAATSTAAAALAAWGVLAMAGNEFGVAVAAATAATALSAASGPLGVRLANRLFRLIANHRRFRVSELRGV